MKLVVITSQMGQEQEMGALIQQGGISGVSPALWTGVIHKAWWLGLRQKIRQLGAQALSEQTEKLL